jgi:hypothetical protein
LPSLVLNRMEDCQEFVWHLDPCCKSCVVQFVRDLTKMLYNKANRVCQSPPYYNCRNARSRRYVIHWREWLFIKRCPNCLIKNIQILWYWLRLFIRSPEQSPEVSCHSQIGDCTRIEDCNKLFVNDWSW